MTTLTATLPTLAGGDTVPFLAGPRVRRICHVSMTLQTGGLERLLVDFGRFHDHSRFDLQFVALEGLGQPAQDLREDGYQVDSLSLRASGKVASIRRLAAILRESGVDLVHTHNTYAHFYGALAARLAGVRQVINTQHGRGCGDSWKAQLQFRMANCWTSKIVGVSEDSARLCRRQDPHAAARTGHVWNGIDLSRFQYHGPSRKPVAISVARLSPVKDFPTLLRGVAKAVAAHPEFRLRIVGDGGERPRLEQLMRDLRLEQHVEFLGERHNVPQLLKEAGFFVSSSKTEGISLTLLEAMAVGLPVLTTSVGGNAEIVRDGETGYLVESLNPDAIAAGISRMLREQTSWPEMGQRGRQRVEEHFSIDGMVRQYETLYDEVLETSGST
jgi:sugar transferase (PEP-CTERM/EpsH1 system associated)